MVVVVVVVTAVIARVVQHVMMGMFVVVLGGVRGGARVARLARDGRRVGRVEQIDRVGSVHLRARGSHASLRHLADDEDVGESGFAATRTVHAASVTASVVATSRERGVQRIARASTRVDARPMSTRGGRAPAVMTRSAPRARAFEPVEFRAIRRSPTPGVTRRC